MKISYCESHGICAYKEGRKFRPSFRSDFLTVVEIHEKEGRNFEPSFTLVQNIPVASYAKAPKKKDESLIL